jgi:hypothetical protein
MNEKGVPQSTSLQLSRIRQEAKLLFQNLSHVTLRSVASHHVRIEVERRRSQHDCLEKNLEARDG